jgi:hypothetical protein
MSTLGISIAMLTMGRAVRNAAIFIFGFVRLRKRFNGSKEIMSSNDVAWKRSYVDLLTLVRQHARHLSPHTRVGPRQCESRWLMCTSTRQFWPCLRCDNNSMIYLCST